MHRALQPAPTPARITLRVKTLVLVGVLLLGLTALLYGLSRSILLDSFSDLEREEVDRNVTRVLGALDAEIAHLNVSALDLATRDSTTLFLQGIEATFVESVLSDNTLADRALHVVLLLDETGALAYGKAYDPERGEGLPLTPALMDAYLGASLTLPTTDEASQASNGVMQLPEAMLLVAIQPVLTVSEDGPATGTLIAGRLLDKTRLAQLGTATQLDLAIYNFNAPDLPAPIAAARTQLAGGQPHVTRPLDDDTIAGYALLNNVFGQPELILQTTMPRDLYQEGRATTSYLLVVLVTASVLFLLITLGLLEVLVLRRVARLSAAVRRIAQSSDPSRRVPARGRDELATLADGINGMLASLQASGARLAASERRYRLLFEHSLAGVFHTTLDGEIVDCNQAFADLLGCDSPAEVCAHPATAFYANPVERAALVAQLRETGTASGLELQLKRRDGTVRWVQEEATLVETEDGSTHIQGICIDITERKQAEQALRQAHDELEQRVAARTRELAAERNLLRTVIDHLPDFIYVKDTRSRFITINQAMQRLLGLESPDAAAGTTDFDYFPAPLAQRFHRDEQHLFETGKPLIDHEEPGTGQEGHPQWVLTTKIPLCDEAGHITGLVGISHDITERRQMEQALRDAHDALEDRVAARTAELSAANARLQKEIAERQRAEAALAAERNLLRTLIDNLPDAVYAKDRQGRFILANKATAWLIGASSPNDLVGKTDADFHAPELASRYRAAERDMMEHDHPLIDHEEPLITRDSTQLWVLSTKVPLHNAAGEVIGLVGVGRDITERRQMMADRERLLDQARARANELATVAQVSRRATTILDMDELLATVVELTTRNFDLYHVHIYLLDKPGNNLALVAGAGEIGRQLVADRLVIPLDHTGSVVARAARTRESVVVNDVARSDEFLPHPLLPETRSELAIPMIVGDELIGVFNVEDNQVDRFSPDDVAIQTTLAAQIAIAIHNARLFTENARRLAIIEHTDSFVGLAPVGDRTRALYVNPFGLRMLGYESLAAFNQRTIPDHYPPEALARLRSEALPVALEHGVWRGESQVMHRDGHLIPVEQALFVIHDENGQPRDLATILVDITARKQADEAIRRANRAFRVLSECNQTMVRAETEDRLLDEVCQIIVEKGGYRMAWVGFLDADAPGRVRCMAQAGHEDGFLDLRADHLGVPPGTVLISPAIRERRPAVVDDLLDESDPDLAAAARQRGYRAAITLPLVMGEDVLGSLNVYAGESNAFDAEEIGLLVELASDLAFGIATLRTRAEHQRAEDELRHQEASLSALVENTTDLIWSIDRDYRLVIVNSAFRQQVAQAYGHEPEPGSLAVEWMDPQDEAWWRTAYTRALAGERFVVERRYELDTLAEMVVAEIAFNPIFDESGAVTGVSVFSRDITRRKRDEQRLRQLFAAEQAQRALAEALSDTAAALTATLDINVVMRQILENVGRVVPHDAANIMLLDHEAGVARVVGSRGYDAFGIAGWIDGLIFPMDDPSYFVHDAIQSKQPVVIPNTRASDRWQEIPETDWIASFAAMPILLAGEVVGLLCLDSATPGFFQPEHARRLQAFADQVAIAINNARLFEQVQRHATDMEEMVRARTAELEQERVQLQAILDSMGEGVLFSNQSEVIFVNPALTQLVGYDQEAIFGASPLDFRSVLPAELDFPAMYDSIIRTFKQGRDSWRGETRLAHRDGHEINVALTITQVRAAEDAKPLGAVTIVRDISQEKALQEQRVRFIAHASHELRTPLTNIKTRIYLARKQPDHLARHLDILEQVTDNMTELVENLLDISRFERGVIPLKRQPVALQTLVEQVVAIQQPEAEKKAIRLSATLPDAPLEITVDPRRIAQVLTNLVTNAIHYTPAGGEITVELARGETGNGPGAILRVSDTGIGMTANTVARIFDPFFRAAPTTSPGTGLGLTIAREIVELHGGTITVESEPGAGSTFTVTLPVEEQE